MKRSILFLVAAAVVACSRGPASIVTPPDSIPKDTTPTLHDPTVLVRNHIGERVYFYWQSGSTVFGADTIAGGVTRCERFTAVADSAYWLIATDTTDAGWGKVWTNYFDPATRPAWTADVTSQSTIIQKDTTAEC